MFESYAQFRTQTPEVLRDTLTVLIADIRRVLVHMELGNSAKLTAVTGLIDRAAAIPPPPPATSPQPVRGPAG